jgi:hypothetical protein
MQTEDVRATLQPAYDQLLAELNHLEAQIKGKKIALNEMAKSMGIDIPYPVVDEESTGHSGRPKIRIDQFLGKPLSTAVAEYLNLCGKQIGAKRWSDIVQALRNGGFELGKTRAAEDAARMTILKNTTVFKLVGDDAFGLVKWYGGTKKQKEKEGSNSTTKKRGRPPKTQTEEEPTVPKKPVKARKEGTPESTATGDEKSGGTAQ